MNKLANIHVFSPEWFRIWQPLLLIILNFPLSKVRETIRESLFLTDFDIESRIIEIRTDCIVAEHEYGQNTAIIFTGNVLANRLYHAWNRIWRFLHAYDMIVNRMNKNLNVGFDTLEFYPNTGNPGTVSVNGALQTNSASWDDAKAGIVHHWTIWTKPVIISGFWDGIYNNWLARAFTNFDTSVLAADAEIDTATWSIMRHRVYGSFTSDYARLVSNSLLNDNEISGMGGDFMRVGSAALAADVWIPQYGHNAVPENWYTWTLNSTGMNNINKDGVSKFALRFVSKDIGGQRGNYGMAAFYGADTIGKEPKLTVNYTPPPTQPTIANYQRII